MEGQLLVSIFHMFASTLFWINYSHCLFTIPKWRVPESFPTKRDEQIEPDWVHKTVTTLIRKRVIFLIEFPTEKPGPNFDN